MRWSSRSGLTKLASLAGLVTVTSVLMPMSTGPAGATVTAAAPIAAAASTAAASTPGSAAMSDGLPHTVGYDKYSFSIDGTRLNLWSAEFHPWRLPSPSLWRDVLQKIKAGGFNAVSIYFDWGYHSPASGVYDFTGVRDMDQLLDLARETGLYVIARPGPYINAETDAGGFPGWLTQIKGNDRGMDADYLAAVDQWWHAINPILARHQLTDGRGPIILYQVENEWWDNVPYFQHLIDGARADGVTVPTFHNDGGIYGSGRQGEAGSVDLYAFDNYPQGFNCSSPDVWTSQPLDLRQARQYSPNGPLFVAEFQGGSFDYWGGPGYDKCRQLTGPRFQRVYDESNLAYGSTAQNFYMTFGGTSWGWLPTPGQVYTSYDYGSAISEGRQLTDKYAVTKELGYLLAAVAPLAKTDDGPNLAVSDDTVQVQSRVNPDTGTQMLVARHADATSTTDVGTTFALTTADGGYPAVPQTGVLRLNGRDSKLLVADWDFGSRQHLVYSTSEIFTSATQGAADRLVLHGRAGEDGETVLRYPSEPTVRVVSGAATATWDAARGDLRLDYRHQGLSTVTVSGGGRADLTLLIGDDSSVTRLWRQDTTAGPVLELGPALVRTARITGTTLALTGDTDAAGSTTVWAPSAVHSLTWNGRSVAATPGADGGLVVQLSGPRPQALPALTGWRTADESASTTLGYDDSSWTLATKQTTNNPVPPSPDQPVLYGDDYGFHHGDLWYRGHFTAQGTETSVDLRAGTGNAGVWSAWLNGTFLGSSTNGSARFDVPTGVLRPGGDNVLAVLVRNMGHPQTYGNNAFKEARGLLSSTVNGSTAKITWRIQGAAGGEALIDPVRGPMNNGGLLGERSGWSLPGYPDSRWKAVSLPATQQPGVSWYRTSFAYAPVSGQDTSVALRYTDDPARHYRAQLFVNGWNLGQFVNDRGPQHDFVIPNGILRKGANTLAIASWAADDSGGLGQVSLVDLGTVAGGVSVAPVVSPAFNAVRYSPPVTHSRVEVTGPSTVRAAETFTVRATFTATDTVAIGAALHLAVTPGWTVTGSADVSAGTIQVGRTATASWQVTAPATSSGELGIATVTGTATQRDRATTAQGAASFQTPLLPPTGTHFVSELPFTASNGWGPVERDMSNGESGTGDGHPITIAGVVYPRGLGAHANSDVQLYLGGNCTRLTATVGVDGEVAGFGTVHFSVVADGKTLVTTGLLTGADPAGVPLDVDLTGAGTVDLLVDDAGDGNSGDHASWGDATLVCNP